MNITIEELEDYLFHNYGMWGKEQGLFMKLIEEIGEVAEVLNMRSGSKRENGENLRVQLAEELADVIHYAVAIAAVNGIDLNRTILEKDKRAAVKYHHDVDLESFVRDRRKESVENHILDAGMEASRFRI